MQRSAAGAQFKHSIYGQYCYNMYVHAWSILLQYVCTGMVNTATVCMYRHGQYCYNMYVHAWSILLQYVCTCMVNTATICMYRHGQYCYNMYVHAWSILLQYVCTGMVNTATICMYRHGIYPGLPGNVPQIPYSHMLTTLGRGLLGQGKGILGQLGTVILYDFVYSQLAI